MEVASENALLNVVDQIYESIERPGLWPETIYAIGGLIGGRRHFWGLDQGIEASDIDLATTRFSFPYGPTSSRSVRAGIRRADHPFPQISVPEHSSLPERCWRP